jgi:hypothetical protein
VSQIRHTFVVTVFEDGRVAVVEDLHSGAHARVDDVAGVGSQIAAWLARPPADDALPRSVGGASRPGE